MTCIDRGHPFAATVGTSRRIPFDLPRWPRDSRQSRDVSQQCQPRMRAQINRFGAAPMFTGTACHDVPSGSPRGYQELFASFGCMAVLVTARRSVGQAVCLCIAAFGVNVLNCRRQGRAAAGTAEPRPCRVVSQQPRTLPAQGGAACKPVTESNLSLCVPRASTVDMASCASTAARRSAFRSVPATCRSGTLNATSVTRLEARHRPAVASLP